MTHAGGAGELVCPSLGLEEHAGLSPPRPDHELDLPFAVTMSTRSRQPVDLSHVDPTDAVKTWGYLRLAMIGVVLGLAVSVLYEHSRAPGGCWQISISAYYYTPARGYFVGALTAIAVCMVCLRGNTALEDILLNIGGMLAPIVAFVPTPNAGTCTSAKAAPDNTPSNIANNVTALLAVGLVALAFSVWMGRREKQTATSLVGLGAAAVVWLVTLVVFEADRRFFGQNAHYTAAVLLFGSIIAVVVVNALGFSRHTAGASLRNRYMAIAALMIAAIVCLLIADAAGYRYWLILLETALLALFGLFWVIQTLELWDYGLRPPPPGTRPPTNTHGAPNRF